MGKLERVSFGIVEIYDTSVVGYPKMSNDRSSSIVGMMEQIAKQAVLTAR